MNEKKSTWETLIEATFQNDKFVIVLGVVAICVLAVGLNKDVPSQTLTILSNALAGLFGLVTGTYIGKLKK